MALPMGQTETPFLPLHSGSCLPFGHFDPGPPSRGALNLSPPLVSDPVNATCKEFCFKNGHFRALHATPLGLERRDLREFAETLTPRRVHTVPRRSVKFHMPAQWLAYGEAGGRPCPSATRARLCALRVSLGRKTSLSRSWSSGSRLPGRHICTSAGSLGTCRWRLAGMHPEIKPSSSQSAFSSKGVCGAQATSRGKPGLLPTGSVQAEVRNSCGIELMARSSCRITKAASPAIS